jgi:glycosyltransferase involved in cell wall biosynthesis
LRILHIGEYVKGGVATYWREVAKYQIAEGHEVFLCMSDYISERDFSPVLSTNIVRYSYRRGHFSTFNALIVIYKTISSLRPDIIHIHSTFAGVLARCCFFFSLPKQSRIIYCAHGWSFIMKIPLWEKKLYGFVEKILSYKTDLIINISRYEYNEAIKFAIPADKCVLVYNGVSKFSGGLDSNTYTYHNHIQLLFVGRFDRQKGFDILLNVFTKERLSNISLIVVGSEVLEDNSRFVTVPNIKNLGWLSPGEVEEQYRLCDAVVMPSRWEGFGLVAIEAMRNKKAVIASNVAALPEIVEDGVNGFLFDVGRPEELVNILRSLNKEQLIRMGLNGYEIYQQKFTSEMMNEKIMKLYEKLLS